VNTSLYARRQPGPGQPLDRFPISPSPCCRRSLFRRPHTRFQRSCPVCCSSPLIA